jgi:hypothetical protein
MTATYQIKPSEIDSFAAMLKAGIPSSPSEEIWITVERVVPDQPRYNAETLAAFQEAEDILSGKIPAKRYYSAKELSEALDALDEDEEC